MRDVAFFRDTLDYRFTEWTVLDDKSDVAVFAMMTTNEQSHDLGLLGDRSGIPGRVHHLAYWLDQRLDVERAADILLEAGTAVEYGPGRHGMGFQTYLYFREPGGMRIELNSGAGATTSRIGSRYAGRRRKAPTTSIGTTSFPTR